MNPWLLAGMLMGACLLIGLITMAAIEDHKSEVVIGHVTREPQPGIPLPDPVNCLYQWETITVMDGGRPNRHHEMVCSRCYAVLWENGDITATRDQLRPHEQR